MCIDKLIVDGNNLAQRIWKGAAPLNTRSGKPTSVVFGVLRSIRLGIEKFKPESVHFTWDDKPTVRTGIFEGYKQKRKEKREAYTPEEQEAYEQFKVQCADLHTILSRFGIHQYKGKDVEADDIVAELSRKGKNVIVSQDKDFLQLVSKDNAVWHPIQDEVYFLNNFEKHTGLPNPQMYLQARFIMGDTSDEIPGVAGFKEGRVLPLILEHKTAAAVLEYAKTIKGKALMETLAGSKDIIVRNMMLMDLKWSGQYMEKPVEDYQICGRFDEKEVKKILISYEFYSFLKQLNKFIEPFTTLK